MKLATMLDHVPVVSTKGSLERRIFRVTRDSREAGEGVVFVAIAGQNFDGHDAIAPLVTGVVVVERDVDAQEGVTVVRVENTRRALAEFSASLENFPSAQMPVVGITGTNGKTTVTTLVEQALRQMGRTVGRIGTTGIAIDGQQVPAEFTTPEAPQLQALLRRMADAKCEVALMEVSSIGLDLFRVHGTRFHTAVFTNLTHDHLDFHGTWGAYRDSKAMLFKRYLRSPGGYPRAIVWGGDPEVSGLGVPDDVWTYGFDGQWDWSISSVTLSAHGMALVIQTPFGEVPLSGRLVGRFNALNLTAALAIGAALGISVSEMATALESVEGAPGRMEQVVHSRNFMVIVDYAHTPDALERSILALKEVCKGRVGVVFGCGGDRDAEKRPLMGTVAEKCADWVVLTSDNPRTENPMAIIEDIREGLSQDPANVLADRREAIQWAIQNAIANDIVLIAGKGHEPYQEIHGHRMPFDDREVARLVLEAL